jgi:hypothetical protein
MKMLFALLLLALAPSLLAQTVESTLPLDGSGVGVQLNSPYGKLNFRPVFAGKFSSVNQGNGDDLVAVSFADPHFICLQNLGNGKMSAPILSGSVSWPINASRLLQTSTGPVLLLSDAGNITEWTFSNCVATQVALSPLTNSESISDFLPGTDMFLVSCNGTGVAVETVTLSNNVCTPLQNSFLVTGQFPLGLNFATIVVTPMPDSQTVTNATIQFGTTTSTSAVTLTNTGALEGENFLGILQTQTGLLAINSNGNQVFVETITFSQEAIPTISTNTIQVITLNTTPALMLQGSFFQDAGNTDLAFLDSVSVDRFRQDSSGQFDPVDSLPLSDIGTGGIVANLMPGETDIVIPFSNTMIQQPINVFASVPFSISGTVAASFTSPATVTFTEAQDGSFLVTATGSPAPSISESGFLPSGITFNAGTNTLAGTPAVGTAGIYNEIVFTATNGTGSPAMQSFSLLINAAAKAPEFAVNTMAVGPGTVNQVPLAGQYLPGTVIQLTAIPNAGATFQGWTGTGGCTGTNSACTVTVGQMNLAPIATFVAASGTPTIVVTPATATGTPGQMFTFTLTTANFGKAPTLMADCSKIPATTCAIQGAMLSVQTSKPSSSTPAFVFKFPPIAPFGLLGMVFGIFVIRKRAARLTLALACLGLLTACGGHVSGALPGNPGPIVNPGTPSGTYMIVISAAGTQTTTAVMLTIQ